MQLRYIGNKDVKTDNVANTNTVWLGHSNVQSVPDLTWPKFAKHPNVWERVDENTGPKATVEDNAVERKKPGPKPKH